MGTAEVLKEVEAERAVQRKKWDGKFDDLMHTHETWHDLIHDYNAWARRMASMGSNEKARRRYVQIAAIAVAAIEAMDLNNKRQG